MNGVGTGGSRAGFVLVGGASSRMGRDKALLPYRGSVLVSAVAEAVREAAGDCVLVGDPVRYRELGHPVIPDLYPGEGPLGGIITALRHTAEDWNVIVACDMPGLTGVFLRRLMDAAERGGADVLMPAAPGGRPEPLCSVYRRRALQTLEAAFAQGVRKVTEAGKLLQVKYFGAEQATLFQNVNTPEDWSPHAAK